MAIKIHSGHTIDGIKKVEALFANHYPENTFEYEFLDQRLSQLYINESRLYRLFQYFTVIALSIALIGLVGLSYYDMEKRTKEIGIRKVNGATTSDMMRLVNKEFTKWIGIGLLISCPISWYAMQLWLRNFAYQTTMNWWIFVFSGLATLIVALLTVSWNTYGAARKNPVDALRHE
jgi:putative ABC transport system permease protein